MAKTSDNNRRSVAEILRELLQYAESRDPDLDRYGEGKFLNQFEQEVADELGMEAAVFLPSGVMAQLVAIKIWAEEQGLDRFACHETCHLIRHEEDAYKKLLNLDVVLVGSAEEVPTVTHLQQLNAQAVSSLVYELPLRHLGGDLPDWEAWSEIKELCAKRCIRLHVDGARLFETEPWYARSVKDILAGVDSVFLSFYKGFGSTSGSMLLGSKWFVDEARLWIRRFGGNLFQIYMLAVPARMNFEKRRQLFPSLVKKARSIGAGLQQEMNLTVRPFPVKTNMFHAMLPGDAKVMSQRAKAARSPDFNLSVWQDYSPPGMSRCEFTVTEASLAVPDEEVLRRIAGLLAP
jgi:threonine aldolase